MRRIAMWVAVGLLLGAGFGMAQADAAERRAGVAPTAPRTALACVRRGDAWVPHAVSVRRVVIGGKVRRMSVTTSYMREAQQRASAARRAGGARRVALLRQARLLAERAERLAEQCMALAGGAALEDDDEDDDWLSDEPDAVEGRCPGDAFLSAVTGECIDDSDDRVTPRPDEVVGGPGQDVPAGAPPRDGDGAEDDGSTEDDYGDDYGDEGDFGTDERFGGSPRDATVIADT